MSFPSVKFSPSRIRNLETDCGFADEEVFRNIRPEGLLSEACIALCLTTASEIRCLVSSGPLILLFLLFAWELLALLFLERVPPTPVAGPWGLVGKFFDDCTTWCLDTDIVPEDGLDDIAGSGDLMALGFTKVEEVLEEVNFVEAIGP